MKQGKGNWGAKIQSWISDINPLFITAIVLVVWGAFIWATTLKDANEIAAISSSLASLICYLIAMSTWYSVRRIRNSIKPTNPQALVGNDVAILCISCINPEREDISVEVAKYIFEEEHENYKMYFREDLVDENGHLGIYKEPAFMVGDTINQYTAAYVTSVKLNSQTVFFGRGRFIYVTVQGLMPSQYAMEYKNYVGCCLEKTMAEIKKTGIRNLKVFCKAPLCVSAMLGYMARNNMGMEFYHRFSNQDLEKGGKNGYLSTGALQLSYSLQRSQADKKERPGETEEQEAY